MTSSISSSRGSVMWQETVEWTWDGDRAGQKKKSRWIRTQWITGTTGWNQKPAMCTCPIITYRIPLPLHRHVIKRVRGHLSKGIFQATLIGVIQKQKVPPKAVSVSFNCKVLLYFYPNKTLLRTIIAWMQKNSVIYKHFKPANSIWPLTELCWLNSTEGNIAVSRAVRRHF